MYEYGLKITEELSNFCFLKECLLFLFVEKGSLPKITRYSNYGRFLQSNVHLELTGHLIKGHK